MFLAFGIGFAALVGATWGYAQWAMEVAPWAWLSLPVCAMLGLGLYLVSLTGQRLGAHQIEHLEHALAQLVSEEAEAADDRDGLA
jgi:Na+-driven multidrug efflux pump